MVFLGHEAGFRLLPLGQIADAVPHGASELGSAYLQNRLLLIQPAVLIQTLMY